MTAFVAPTGPPGHRPDMSGRASGLAPIERETIICPCGTTVEAFTIDLRRHPSPADAFTPGRCGNCQGTTRRNDDDVL